MSLDLVVPRCPLCGSTEQSDHARYDTLVWVRCACGLVFKKFAAPEAADAVPELGSEGLFGSGSEYSRRYARRRRHRVAKSVRQLRDAVEHLPRDRRDGQDGPVRVLDVGCSLGYTLDAARELGLEPAGVDVSGVAVEACRASGHVAEIGQLASLPFPDGHFAIVVMKHVLEHTPDPQAALAEARRVLEPGGVLFVAVPHAGYRKAVRDPQASRFYRPDAHGGAEHWVYYTPGTLSRVMQGAGFRVRHVHPLLRHERAGAARRLGQTLLLPLRAAGQQLLSALALRKEFWLVATR
jgi:SAM-dependent methyltransferase